MKVKTDFYCTFFHHPRYWNNLDEELRNNKARRYVLCCENHGSMIVVLHATYNDGTAIIIQVGSWTLEYYVQ